MAKVVREKEFRASKKALFEAITDFPSYPDFLPEVVGAKIREKQDPERVVVDFELEIMKRFQYTLEFHLTDHTEVAWKLKESNFFKTNEGRWLLKEVGPDRTQVTYELDLSMSFFVPNWVTKKLTEVNLPQMFESFEKRAQTKS